ncbi:hypothetical protein FGG08_003278 [Glutinoglossum americanum]|uniref:Uncharacterized protein n=1 Tax=Glutinoglossum americanum TaxID=1670608 RepID=A0A9P8KYB5_9PEZI|nr:hypothetical protein FGG08_003278 [Glutinoglossum americanum]
MPPASPQDTPPPQQPEEADEEILSPAARAERDNPRPPPPAAPPTPPLPDHAYDFAPQYIPQPNQHQYATHRHSYVPRGHPDSINNPPPVIVVTQPTFVEHMVPDPHTYLQGDTPVHPMGVRDPHGKAQRHRREILVHFTLCTCVARHDPDDLGWIRRECIGSADLTAGPFKCDVSANGVMALLGAVVTWPFVCCIGSTWGLCRVLSGGCDCRHR